MAFTLPPIPSKISCPQGDIFDFPTPADLTNILNEIGQIPSKLKAYVAEKRDELTEDAQKEIDEVIAKIEEWREKVADILSPWWNRDGVDPDIRKRMQELMAELETKVGEKYAEERDRILADIETLKLAFNTRDWQAEARQAVQEFIQEMHIYIPMKVAELISKITSFSLKVTLFGISIDVAKLATKAEQERIKLQICEKIDYLYDVMPEAYRTFDGTFGVDDKKKRCQAVWSWIKSEIQDWLTNGIFKLAKTLIKIFKVIWKLLGLPDLSALFEFDVAGYIDSKISKYRTELRILIENLKSVDLSEELRKEYNERIQKLRELVCRTLEDMNILGFTVLELLGGEIKTTVKSCDELIQSYVEAFRDFAINWKKKLLFAWIKIVKKFFDKIGLGKIFEPISLTFCDILEMLGFPFDVPSDISTGLSALAAAKVIEIDESQTFNFNTTVKGSGTVNEYLEVEDALGRKTKVTSQEQLNEILERSERVNVAYYQGDGVTDKFIAPTGKGTLRVYLNNKRLMNIGALGVSNYVESANYVRFLDTPKEGDIISLIRI